VYGLEYIIPSISSLLHLSYKVALEKTWDSNLTSYQVTKEERSAKCVHFVWNDKVNSLFRVCSICLGGSSSLSMLISLPAIRDRDMWKIAIIFTTERGIAGIESGCRRDKSPCCVTHCQYWNVGGRSLQYCPLTAIDNNCVWVLVAMLWNKSLVRSRTPPSSLTLTKIAFTCFFTAENSP